MLDTNILIYLIKNKPPSVAQRINALESQVELCMSFITFAELLKGAERSTRQPDVIRQLDALTRVIPVRYAIDRDLSALRQTVHPVTRCGHTHRRQRPLDRLPRARPERHPGQRTTPASSSASLAFNWRTGRARGASGHGAMSILQKRCRCKSR